MKIAIMHGPNLNRLGKRNPERYGTHTLADITDDVDQTAARLGVEVEHFQSNHEGALLDWLHERQDGLDAVVINPAGLTPYGRALWDALADTQLPIAIVHIAALFRYPTQKPDIFLDLANLYIAGYGWRSYSIALQGVVDHINDRGRG